MSCLVKILPYFSIVFHPLCDTCTRLISPAGQIFLRSVRDGLNLSQSSRRNKQKSKTEDRGQLCPMALMSGAGREQLQRPKQRTAWEQTACSRLKMSLNRPHEMHPRWWGRLQRKEDSRPKQYYFWQWIIGLAHQAAMILAVIHFTQVLLFCFSWALCKDRGKNRWRNRCSKNNSAIVSRTTQRTCLNEKKKNPTWNGKGGVLWPLQ